MERGAREKWDAGGRACHRGCFACRSPAQHSAAVAADRAADTAVAADSGPVQAAIWEVTEPVMAMKSSARATL